MLGLYRKYVLKPGAVHGFAATFAALQCSYRSATLPTHSICYNTQWGYQSYASKHPPHPAWQILYSTFKHHPHYVTRDDWRTAQRHTDAQDVHNRMHLRLGACERSDSTHIPILHSGRPENATLACRPPARLVCGRAVSASFADLIAAQQTYRPRSKL